MEQFNGFNQKKNIIIKKTLLEADTEHRFFPELLFHRLLVIQQRHIFNSSGRRLSYVEHPRRASRPSLGWTSWQRRLRRA